MASLDAANLFSVKGLVAVITGGGSGIGLMMAKALAANGAAKVYILGRRKEVLDIAAKESGFKDSIIPIVADVTSKDSLTAAVKQITSEVGFINVLVANAGQVGPRHGFTPEISLEDFQSELWTVDFSDYLDVFAANTVGVWFTVVAFLGLLDAGNKKGNVAQSSQVISTGSVGGFNRKTPGNFAYSQSKAAVTHLTKQLATVLVPFGIRSNMIAPGRTYPLNGGNRVSREPIFCSYSGFQTGDINVRDLTSPIVYPSDSVSPFLATFNNVFPKTIVPAERIGTEEDMAGCILYLTSPAGAYLCGSVILTDGGSLSILPATY